MLSFEICETFKNIDFEEYLSTTASKLYLKRDCNTDLFLRVFWIIQEYMFCRPSLNGWFWNNGSKVSLY